MEWHELWVTVLCGQTEDTPISLMYHRLPFCCFWLMWKMYFYNKIFLSAIAFKHKNTLDTQRFKWLFTSKICDTYCQCYFLRKHYALCINQGTIGVRCNSSSSTVVLNPNEHRVCPSFKEVPEFDKAWIHKSVWIIPQGSRPILSQ